MRIGRELEGRLDGAGARLAPHVRHTPLRKVSPLDLMLKCENRQITGSFKLRGAMNALLVRREEAVRRTVVAASAGNHGQGVAYAARMIGARATVYVPDGTLERKVAAIRELGADVISVRGGYAATERTAREAAAGGDAVWISPYNDLDVIAGQGTVGLEMAGWLTDWDRVPDVYVPVGGGGLISGIAAALRGRGIRAKVIGVQPEASPFLYAHHTDQSRSDVRELPTRADGLAGDVEDGSVTLELIDELVDEMRLVSEEEILEAVVWSASELGEVIEPCAAAALAAWRRDGGRGWAVVVLTGGNVDPLLIGGKDSV
jgi:threonine dehydratase